MKTIFAILGIAMLLLVACTAPKVQTPTTQEPVIQETTQITTTPEATEIDTTEIETTTAEADDLSKELDTFEQMDKDMAEIDSMEFD